MIENTSKITLEVGKMTCAACAVSIESLIKSKKGILWCNYCNVYSILYY